jgi:hypothetical protein
VFLARSAFLLDQILQYLLISYRSEEYLTSLLVSFVKGGNLIVSPKICEVLSKGWRFAVPPLVAMTSTCSGISLKV